MKEKSVFSYIHKMKDWMFNQEGEETYEAPPTARKKPKEPYVEQEVKMQHYYPKNTLRGQEKPERQERSTSKKVEKARPKKHADTSTERPKFQGQNFKVQEIPRQLYRPEDRKLERARLAREVQQEYTAPKDNEEEKVVQTYQVNEEQISEELTSHQSDDPVIVDVEEVKEDNYKQEELMEVTPEPLKATLFEEESVERLEDRSEKQPQNVEDKEERYLAEPTHEDAPATPFVEEVPKQHVKREKEQEQSHYDRGLVYNPAVVSNMEKKKGQVPFNVMMKQTDKKHYEKRKHEQEASYMYPAIQLLAIPERPNDDDAGWVTEMEQQLNETFQYFNVKARVVHKTKGPSVTRFEVQPEPGVKINKIVQLTDDIKRALAATEIRLEAPIPGKTTVGIEVPNKQATPVSLRSILHSGAFKKAESPLTVALGMDIAGQPIVTDLASMPHGLIAGTTGSGKSVAVNSMLTSILYKSSPKEVRLLLIDPKMVELAPFNAVPHLAAPVITDAKEATLALKWAVEEMDHRYELFAKRGARDLNRYNKKMEEDGLAKLPKLVIVVDELADLMMVAAQEVEDAICRIAQKARACGIHLLVATQRPSVDVITGLIKANIPTRIAFSVSSSADSRTILDSGGAERLLGKGDMLFMHNSSPKPVRIQGTYVSDDEIDRVIDYVSKSPHPGFLFEKEQLTEAALTNDVDELFEEAVEFVREQQVASASLLQRNFRLGYNRAARLIDDMEARGIVSGARGSKPRDVL
ncbi:DNA translocase FtsK [Paenalkalicoccus suaedae]|nr:DNA translocase FtsK [Paenalkalicoccus suaedae]